MKWHVKLITGVYLFFLVLMSYTYLVEAYNTTHFACTIEGWIYFYETFYLLLWYLAFGLTVATFYVSIIRINKIEDGNRENQHNNLKNQQYNRMNFTYNLVTDFKNEIENFSFNEEKGVLAIESYCEIIRGEIINKNNDALAKGKHLRFIWLLNSSLYLRHRIINENELRISDKAFICAKLSDLNSKSLGENLKEIIATLVETEFKMEAFALLQIIGESVKSFQDFEEYIDGLNPLLRKELEEEGADLV